ncbi:hypothetical protein MRX96_033054 [Rhipicephalus microplus]
MRGLKALGIGEDSYNTMLYSVLLRVFPREIILNYHWFQAEAQQKPSTSFTNGSTSSATSATEHLMALATVLPYFRLELERRERTQDHGPDHSLGDEMWPIERRSGGFMPEELEQGKGIEVLNVALNDEGELFDLARFSFALKVELATAWVLRFVKNLHSRFKTSGSLTAEEIERTHNLWLKKAGKCKVAYDHYRLLCKVEENQQLCVVPKLTQAHIDPDCM